MQQFISRIDHLVLTVRNIEATCNFYHQVLGMQIITFADNRKALQFGQQKINLHQARKEFEPKAIYPTPGFCGYLFYRRSPTCSNEKSHNFLWCRYRSRPDN